MAKGLDDNLSLRQFQQQAEQAHPDIPLIAINMGENGRMSRVLNRFLTPVSHPLLPSHTAPGQLSAREISTVRCALWLIPSKRFLLFGKPIAHSRSPALHNTLFAEVGLQHHYEALETDQIQDIVSIIRSPNFGGASVTIQLKQNVLSIIDRVAPDAAIIGAVNTIVPVHSSPGQIQLVGHNTDWQGIMTSLQRANSSTTASSAIIVGAGGTARAAVYALHIMRYSPIYLLARPIDRNQALNLKSNFATDYDLRLLSSLQDLESPPAVTVGTIPGDYPYDSHVVEILNGIFERAAQRDVELEAAKEEKVTRVLLDMAYKPAVTQLMQMAKDFGWVVVPGSEALIMQGVKQVSEEA